MRKKNTISKIRKLKETRKEEIEIEVKEAADKLDIERDKLIAIEKNYEEKLSCFNTNNADGTLDVNRIKSYYEYFTHIDGKIKEQKDVNSQCKKDLNTLKESLVLAHQDQKMFEIMEDKIDKKNLKEKAQSEQKEADFFVLARRLKP